MTHEEIKRFLSELGIEHTKLTGEWVNATCPLAKYKHQSGKDKRPSFGIHIADNGDSMWKCFTCSPNPQAMYTLVQQLWRASGHYPRTASVILMNGAHTQDEPVKVYEPHDSWKSYSTPPSDKIPDDVLEIFPLLTEAASQNMWDYLTKRRHIDKHVIQLMGIRCLPEENLLIFPYTNHLGEVTSLKARNYLDKKIFTVTPKYIGQPWLRFRSAQTTGAWFGLHYIDWLEPVFIVEGEIDQMRMLTLGKLNSIAAGTCGISKAQHDALHGINYRLGFDDDKAGKEAVLKAYRMLKDNSIVSILDWGVVGCKDAGDILNHFQMAKVMENVRMAL